MLNAETPGFDRASLDALLHALEQSGPSLDSAGQALCEAFDHWSAGAGREHPDLDSIRADVLFVRGMRTSASGDYERSIDYLHEAIQVGQRAGNTRRHIYSLCALAVGFEYAGMQEESSDHILEALTLADSLGEDRIRAAVSHSLTALYQAQGAYELMLESAMRTLAIAQELNDSHLLLRTYSAISLAYAELGQASVGVDWLERGIDLIDDSTQPFVETLLYLNLVYIHRCNGELERAAVLADDYIDQIVDLPAPHAAVLYVDLAELYVERGDLDRAEAMLQAAESVAEPKWMKVHLLNYFSVASDVYEARGDTEKALRMLREYVELERGVRGRQAQIRMVAIERHFAADLIARTDELHHVRTVELVAKNEQLATLIREKKDVLDVVVNDIRNPLAAVVLLTDLLLSQPRSGIDEGAVKVVRSIREAALEMGAAVDRLVTPDHIDLTDDFVAQLAPKPRSTHPTVG